MNTTQSDEMVESLKNIEKLTHALLEVTSGAMGKEHKCELCSENSLHSN